MRIRYWPTNPTNTVPQLRGEAGSIDLPAATRNVLVDFPAAARKVLAVAAADFARSVPVEVRIGETVAGLAADDAVVEAVVVAAAGAGETSTGTGGGSCGRWIPTAAVDATEVAGRTPLSPSTYFEIPR